MKEHSTKEINEKKKVKEAIEEEGMIFGGWYSAHQIFFFNG